MKETNAWRETFADASQLGAKMFRVRFPFLDEFRRYSWAKLRHDLVAGATLTLVSVPQAIGFALILGLPPMAVVMTVVIGGFVSALFFSSHYHVFGPTTSVSLITAATIAANREWGLAPLPLAAYLAILIGIAQFVAGLLNFGEITKFISRSVVIGYTTAIGLLLITSQAPNFLGFRVAAGERLPVLLRQIAVALGTHAVSGWSIAIALLTLALFEALQRWRRTWPESLIGLALLGLASRVFVELIARYHVFGFSHAPFLLIADEGALSAALPALAALPGWSQQVALLPHLASTAIAIAIIGMLEATAITKSLAAKSGQHVEPNQELLGMGAGNIAAGLFGAPPASSSFTRSAVNYQSGAASQFSSMLSSVIVLVILLFLTPVFNYIPVPALAAHLMRVGFKLINRPQIRIACRSTRSDAAVFLVTLLAALFLRLESAIYVGIATALALFLQKTSAPVLVEYVFSQSGELGERTDSAGRHHAQISIIHVEGALFFGAADLFHEQVRRLTEDNLTQVFILRLKNARHLDASTVMALDNLYDFLRENGRHLLFSGCNADAMRVLRNSGLLAKVGAENVFAAEANLTMSTKRAVARAAELLAEQSPEVRLYYSRTAESAATAEPPTP